MLPPPPAAPTAGPPPAPDVATGAAATSVTALLVAHRAGDADALERVFPLVYAHLRAVARAQLRRDGRGRDGAHTLSTTALVHEAYFKLADAPRLDARDRAHFLAVAARAMRQVLVEYARRHRAAKRGGGAAALDLDAAQVAVEERADALVALDEALSRLAALSERLARVVELRFFGGLSEEETAAALGVTDRTVRRDWVKARAWLHAELASGGPPPGGAAADA
jgi:RNA polymerase sigma factor (TIGR02999 family)